MTSHTNASCTRAEERTTEKNIHKTYSSARTHVYVREEKRNANSVATHTHVHTHAHTHTHTHSERESPMLMRAAVRQAKAAAIRQVCWRW